MIYSVLSGRSAIEEQVRSYSSHNYGIVCIGVKMHNFMMAGKCMTLYREQCSKDNTSMKLA